MNIERSIDVEDEIRKVLNPYMTCYCRPLPAKFSVPSILVTQVGGGDLDHIDSLNVVLDSRAEHEAEALEQLRNALGVLRTAVKEQTSPLRFMEVASSGSWGSDPLRQDLAMCSATIRVVAHLENTTINSKEELNNGV